MPDQLHPTKVTGDGLTTLGMPLRTLVLLQILLNVFGALFAIAFGIAIALLANTILHVSSQNELFHTLATTVQNKTL